GFARHTKDNASRLVLGNGEGISALHFQETIRAIVAHARQQDSYSIGSSGLRRGTEQHIHAWPMTGDQGAITNFKKILGAHPANERMPIPRSDIAAPRNDWVAIGGFSNLDCATVVKSPRECRGETFGHVLHRNDAWAIRGHPLKHMQQRFGAPRGCTNGNKLLHLSG